MPHRERAFRKGYLSAVFLAAAAAFAAVFAIAAISHPNGSDPLGAAIISVFVYALWLLSWQSAVRMGPSGVVVDNLLMRHVIPWADLADIQVGAGLEFRLREGRTVRPLIFGGSLIGQVLGYRYTRRVAERMRATWAVLSALETDAPPDSGGYRCHVHVNPWSPLAILACLEAVAVLALAL